MIFFPRDEDGPLFPAEKVENTHLYDLAARRGLPREQAMEWARKHEKKPKWTR